MNHNILASNIRATERRHRDEEKQYVQELGTLKFMCQHPYQIITNSAYRGSYSYDYEDGHEENRLCLVCGRTECGPDFKVLRKPMARFEISDGQVKDSPFAWGKLLMTPLSVLLKYVRDNGYKVI